MTYDAHGHGHAHEPEPHGDTGWTGFAIAKYGFILLIVIVVLWFLATYIFGD